MELLRDSLLYAVDNRDFFWKSVVIHLQLSAVSLGIAVLIGVPLGAWLARRGAIAGIVLNGFSAVRVVPSLAILFLAFPYLGLSFRAALVALTVLAIPPVLINSYTGFRGVEAAVLESARGMGMSPWQVLSRIEFPLALPVLMTGIRAATVEVVASAGLAAFIGAGGLGDFVLRGFAVRRTYIMLVGAVPIALLALAAEWSLAAVQRQLLVPAVRAES
jgi:osmoprotectant transport system permease protein